MMENKIQIEVKLEYTDVYVKTCRVCLLEGTLYIFSKADIVDSIELFGGISISQDDSFPKYLCKSCHCLLQSAILFRKKAQETDLKLNKDLKQNSSFVHLRNTLLENTDVKNEGSDSLDSSEGNTIKQEACGSDEMNVFEKDTISVNSESPNITRINVELVPEAKKHSSNSKSSKTSSNISNSLSKKIYECTSCEIKFCTRKEYTIHIKSNHSRIQCPICNKFASAQRFKRHLANHQTDSYVVCEICGNMFQKGAMAKHLLLHNNKLPYPCKLCPYRGRYAEALRLHMRRHTGQKPYTCDICQMSFMTKSNLNRHSLTHSKLRPHKCIECNKDFRTNRDMVMHIKTDHKGIKDFECKICGNKYGAKRVLRKHEVRVHKRDKMIGGRKPLYLQPEFTASV